MRTTFEAANQEFSNKAHMLARTDIYPLLFNLPLDRIEFESVTGLDTPRHQILDGEMAVDRIVNVTTHGLR
jgi:hypothetical protein